MFWLPMSRLPWSALIVRQREIHLVAGLATDDLEAPALREARTVMLRLVRQFRLDCSHAATIVREGACPQLQLAFEAEADAERVGARLGAERADDSVGWASRRLFRLDEAIVARVAASLPPPRQHSKAEPAAGPGSVRRVRYAPRRKPWTTSE
jgi:hypothetical protein